MPFVDQLLVSEERKCLEGSIAAIIGKHTAVWSILEPPTSNYTVEDSAIYSGLAAYGLCFETFYSQHPEISLLSICNTIEDYMIILTGDHYCDYSDFMTIHDYFCTVYQRNQSSYVKERLLSILTVAQVRHTCLKSTECTLRLHVRELVYLAKCLWNLVYLFNHKLAKVYLLKMMPYLMSKRNELDDYSRAILLLLTNRLNILYKDTSLTEHWLVGQHLHVSMRIKNNASKEIIHNSSILL